MEFPDPHPTLTGQFNAFVTPGPLVMPYTRRDFYKISLYTSATTHIQWAGQTLIVDRPALVFYNPLLPYAGHTHTALKEFYCLFTERFLLEPNRDVSLQEPPLFRIGTTPIVYLTDEQVGITRFVAGSI